jgi:NADPH:quinone reductase-like Zn-dependent oxidoreductase
MMPRAVRYDKYGGIDVLGVAEVERPTPGDDQILVRVKAAGTNPGETPVREGLMHDQWPATFPSGQGSDFAGVVEESNADGFEAGDEVLGFVHDRSSQAEYVVADAENVARKPSGVSWEAAGGLAVVGSTAWAALRAVGVRDGETLLVSGAAGGVGSLVTQLARNAGAKVIGLASEHNHDWLREHGATPVAYGDGLADRMRAIGNVDALVDTFGSGYVKLAIEELGVARERINTIRDWDAVETYGVKRDGNLVGARREVLAELAEEIAAGRLEVPIAATYKLEQVREAYTELERRHTRGKIVLVP